MNKANYIEIWSFIYRFEMILVAGGWIAINWWVGIKETFATQQVALCFDYASN